MAGFHSDRDPKKEEKNMKKLMIATLAGLCAAVTFGDLVSQVVGYKNKNLREGFTMAAPMFLNTTDASVVKLGDLTVTGYTAYDSAAFSGGTSGEVYLIVLDSLGRTKKDSQGNDMSYFYYDDLATDPVWGGQGAGWYTMGATLKLDADKITFDVGDALWIAGKNGYTVLCKGQVLSGNTNIPLQEGFTPCGNPYPVEIPLANFAVTGYTAYDPATFSGGTSGEVYLIVLDSLGRTAKDENGNDKSYFYYDDLATDTTWGGFGSGWYTMGAASKLDAENTKFAAGEGLWVSGKPNYFLNLKSPVSFQ